MTESSSTPPTSPQESQSPTSAPSRTSELRAKFDSLPKDVRTYLVIFGILMALLVVTVAVAYIPHLPSTVNVAVALTIAIIKATLVVLYFMHVKEATHVTWVFAGSAFLWLAIMIALTMADYATRNDTPGQIPDVSHPSIGMLESSLAPR